MKVISRVYERMEEPLIKWRKMSMMHERWKNKIGRMEMHQAYVGKEYERGKCQG